MQNIGVRRSRAGSGSGALASLAWTIALLAAPAPTAAASSDAANAAAIKATLDAGCAAFEAGDKKGAMAPLLDSPELIVFDFSPPRSKSWRQLYEDNAAFAEMATGKPTCRYLETHPTILSKTAAYSWSIMRFAATFKSGKSIDVSFRETDIWRKIRGRWFVVHEHNSFPVDIFTGQADLRSRP